MDARGIVVFEVEKNGHKYAFHAPLGTPYGEAHDALYEIIEHVIELAKKSADTAKAQNKADIEASSEK